MIISFNYHELYLSICHALLHMKQRSFSAPARSWTEEKKAFLETISVETSNEFIKSSPFLKACCLNFRSGVKLMLSIYPKLLTTTIGGIYPLEYMCLKDNYQMTLILCEHLKKLKLKYDFERALQICYFKNNVKIYEILLNYIDYSHFHFVSKIILHKRFVSFDYLMASGRIQFFKSYNGLTVAHWAVLSSCKEWLSYVLISSSQLKLKTYIHELTVLHLAVINNDQEMVEKLINIGADPLTKTKRGYNNMHLAIIRRNISMFEYFYEKWPILCTIPDSKGYLPIHFALLLNEKQAFLRLFNYFDDRYFFKDPQLVFSLFSIACYLPHTDLEVVYLLLQIYIKKPSHSKFGYTPLHILAALSRPRLINLFFDKLIMSTIHDEQTNSPIHIAVINGNYGFLRFALKWFPLDIQNKCGDTPLHVACALGQTKIVKMLLKHGYDINARNYEMYTPLMLAVLNNRLYIVAYLTTFLVDPDALNIFNASAITFAKFSGSKRLYSYLQGYQKLFQIESINETPF